MDRRILSRRHEATKEEKDLTTKHTKYTNFLNVLLLFLIFYGMLVKK